MALQDLTPQLRTRLSRMERAVGWFVLLATLLLVSGFAYYVYHTAQRKGWFLVRAPYSTYLNRATGLKVGDPVNLMGFDVGHITCITAMRADWEYSPVYVEFDIKEPFYGYLWSVGSVARVTSADLLGQRALEVTKGTKGYPIYTFNPLRIVSLGEARRLPDLDQWRTAEEIFDPTETRVLVPALKPLSPTNLDVLASLGRTELRVLDTRTQRKSITGVWVGDPQRKLHGYDFYARTNLYWLVAEETPAVSEQLDKIVAEVNAALPGFFELTNQIVHVLTNTAVLTSNLNVVALHAQPAAANLAALTSELRGPGALGQWLLPTNLPATLETTLTNASRVLATANTALGHTDTNLTGLVENLNRSLENLAGITSNLNTQVQANTNVLTAISDAIVHADEFIQGLKRHWLFRSAFKTTPAARPDAPPQILRSPKDSSER